MGRRRQALATGLAAIWMTGYSVAQDTPADTDAVPPPAAETPDTDSRTYTVTTGTETTTTTRTLTASDTPLLPAPAPAPTETTAPATTTTTLAPTTTTTTVTAAAAAPSSDSTTAPLSGFTDSSISPDDPLARSAAIYGAFQSDVTTYRSRMASAAELEETIAALGGQNPDQLAAGWLAYSALIASTSPEFAASVREVDANYGREMTLKGLRYDREYWRTVKNGSRAINLAVAAADADARRLRSVGSQIKDQAYSLQAMGWAKRKVGGADAVLGGLELARTSQKPHSQTYLNLFTGPQAGQALRMAGRSGAPSLWDGLQASAGNIRLPSLSLPAFSSAPRTRRITTEGATTANHIATLAAYRVLGISGTETSDVQNALAEPEIAGCVTMAQLQLQGCVAANHFHYERPFCTGEYLNDLSECIDKLGY